MGFALRAYALAADALFPLIRERLRKRYPVGFDERCGLYRPGKLERIEDRRALWIHAVSVGEAQAASPLVSAAARDGWDGATVVSTVTETGARNAALLMGGNLTAHIYAPWDIPRVCARACDALAPSAYVTVETEIWPNLLHELRRRGVPRFLLNARVSDRTWARAKYLRGVLREAYDLFDRILARGGEDARRLARLGISEGKIHAVGDCKIDAILERRKTASESLPGWRRKLSLPEGTPCFVAGSTHEGEEEVVFEAFSRFSEGEEKFADARLLLVPRHPHRGGALKERAGHGAAAVLLSEIEAGTARPARVVVVDVIGVLFELYGLATAAFVGGSLVARGGQNILEPACWGAPIQHGPHMEDFAEPTAAFDALGASQRVTGAGELANLWRRAAAGELREASEEGARYLVRQSGAAELAWGYVKEGLAGRRNVPRRAGESV